MYGLASYVCEYNLVVLPTYCNVCGDNIYSSYNICTIHCIS